MQIIPGYAKPAFLTRFMICGCFLFYPLHCKQHRIQHRLFNVPFARIAQFRYQVAVVDQTMIIPDHKCGGSIIGKRRVLTAAHCVENRSQGIEREITPNLSVLAGTIRRMDTFSSEAVLTPAIQILLHPRRDWAKGRNDFAIIRTRHDLYQRSSNKTGPIRLAGKRPADYTKCVVSGWGKRNADGSSRDLRYMTQYVLNDALCARKFRRRLQRDWICAAGMGNGGADEGDYGGALVCDGRLVGVLSNAGRLNRTEMPKVYASVWSVREWLIDGDTSVIRGLPKASGARRRIVGGRGGCWLMVMMWLAIFGWIVAV